MRNVLILRETVLKREHNEQYFQSKAYSNHTYQLQSPMEDSATRAPTSLTLHFESVTESSVDVVITPPPNDSPPITQYEIRYYKASGSTSERAKITVPYPETESPTYVPLTQLEANSKPIRPIGSKSSPPRLEAETNRKGKRSTASSRRRRRRPATKRTRHVD